MKIRVDEKLLWKYILCCLNNKNCYWTTQPVHIFSLFFIKQSQLKYQHKPINLERTHHTQHTKNETSKHFGPSPNPLDWEWTQQLYTRKQHTTQLQLKSAQIHNTNQHKPSPTNLQTYQNHKSNTQPKFPKKKKKKEDLTWPINSQNFVYIFL